MDRVYNLNRLVSTEKQAAVGEAYSTDTAVAKVNSVDLRRYCPPVYDQGQLGSCTAFSGAKGMLETLLRQKNGTAPSLAALYVYYYERSAEHTVAEDVGAQVVDAAYVMLKRGCSTEAVYPYDISGFTSAPPAAAEVEAPLHKLVSAQHLHTLDDMIHCLQSGYPFIGGIDIFAAFESETVALTGNVPMPVPGEKYMGGHAICFVGFNLVTRKFLVRNSWGPDWGEGGYFWLPFDYAIHYGSDFWTGRV